MKETISFIELFQVLKKRLWLIGIITILIAIFSAVISFFILTPVYQAKTQLLVNQEKTEQQAYNFNEVQANIQLVNTYSVIIKSRAILELVKEELNLKQTVEELDQQIQVTSVKDSQIVEITVEDNSINTAVRIANTTATIFQEQIQKMMKIDNVSIVSPAAVEGDISPVKPNPMLNIAIGIILGLVLSIGIVFLLEFLDNTVKSEEDVEKILGLPIIGVITSITDVPNAKDSRSSRVSNHHRARGSQLARKQKHNNKQLTAHRRIISHIIPKSPTAEQYRTLRSNIQFSNVDKDIKSIVMTSSGPGEGKSTTAANLAIVYAQQGSKVLLVDADLRKPTAHYSFKLENFIGFTSILTKNTLLKESVQSTEIPNLSVLTSGPIPPNPSELLASIQMKKLLQEMKEEFDFIILDTPPTLAVTDAQILANQADGTILVVSSGKAEKSSAIRAKELLINANANILE